MKTNQVENAVQTTEKQPKRASVSLTAGDGEKRIRLTLMARRMGGNRGETVALTTDAKKKTQRGMTTKYESFDKAKEALEKLINDAVKAGWQRSKKNGAFQAKPDAFSTLPTPPKAR